MRRYPWTMCCLLIGAVTAAAPALHPGATPAVVRVYLTTADLSSRLTRQPNLRFSPTVRRTDLSITVDATRRYQRIVGFGGALTDTSAWLLRAKLRQGERDTVMQRLFDPVHGIGLSFMRVPIAASDFTSDGTVYSYDDLPAGQVDTALDRFSITHDITNVIPILQQARQINPRLTLMATPWSPPGWMKETPSNDLAGVVSPASFAPLAAYFVKFLQAYQSQGIPIAMISPQNEPGPSAASPGIAFPASSEADFIANYLGPALEAAHLHPRILAYDSYWNTRYTTPDYPFIVMGNAAAWRHLAGTAWHCYEGSPDIMAAMHARYPRMDNYETECSSGIAHGDVTELLIASARNWASGALLWNIALDMQGGPKEGANCNGCIAPVTIDQQSGQVSYTSDYYQLGQASAFVRPGAYRIASTSPVTRYKGSGLGCRNATSYGSHTVDDVAFENPDGSIALLAYNAAPPAKSVTVRWGPVAFSYTLPACATATFVWRPA